MTRGGVFPLLYAVLLLNIRELRLSILILDKGHPVTTNVDRRRENRVQIAVTGGTGFIGRMLVPALSKRGADVLLVGRNIERMKEVHADLPCMSYEEFFSSEINSLDVILHLAAVNSDSKAPREIYEAVNVDLTMDVAKKAKNLGVGRFINVSSTHALPHGPKTLYAETKRKAAERLSSFEGLSVTTLYLPLVHGSEYSGKLLFLNRMPKSLAMSVFCVLSTLKPTLNVMTLADQIMALSNEKKEAPDKIIVTDPQNERLLFSFFKRAIDLLFVLSVIAVFWWLMIGVWVAVRASSPGPGIFTQQRVGRHGQNFTCVKFRTMRVGTESRGTHEVSPASITPVGRLLRRTKIDELPQVWNIIRNDMSLIGPRPGLPIQEELFAARARHGVFKVKPGISGLAQVQGIDMSDPERLARVDAEYIKLQSLLLDVKLIFKTVSGGGQGDKVRQAE